jgi:hypothetical protein
MPKFNEYLTESDQPDFSSDPKFQERMKNLRKPEPDSLLSFKTMNGKEWILAIVAEKSFGGLTPKLGYVSKDKKLFARGTYSGGITGAGINDYIRPVGVDAYGDIIYFLKFYK